MFSPSLVCSQPLNHSKLSLLSPIQRAEILLKRSLNEEALLLYKSLVLKDGANGYAFRGLVRAYKGMGRLDDAESWIETYLIEKSFTSAALYASGYIFYLKEDVKKAEELFKKALELDDANALALNNLGAVRLSEKSYTQAVKLVRKAIQINPKEPMFFKNLETIYKQMGNPSLIVTDYNFYLKEKEDLDLIRGYGLAVGAASGDDVALRICNNAIANGALSAAITGSGPAISIVCFIEDKALIEDVLRKTHYEIIETNFMKSDLIEVIE